VFDIKKLKGLQNLSSGLRPLDNIISHNTNLYSAVEKHKNRKITQFKNKKLTK